MLITRVHSTHSLVDSWLQFAHQWIAIFKRRNLLKAFFRGCQDAACFNTAAGCESQWYKPMRFVLGFVCFFYVSAMLICFLIACCALRGEKSQRTKQERISEKERAVKQAAWCLLGKNQVSEKITDTDKSCVRLGMRQAARLLFKSSKKREHMSNSSN